MWPFIHGFKFLFLAFNSISSYYLPLYELVLIFFPNHIMSLFFFHSFLIEGAVYIQIIRCSNSLIAITEAQDALMNFWDFEKYIWNLDIFDWDQKYSHAFFACVL